MLKIALFGAGRIGRIHAANIHWHPACQLAAVVDPQQDFAEALAQQYNVRPMRAEEVWSSDIDAVFICSATDTHADLIEAAARANKAIFCEKPIDLSVARVENCLRQVRQQGARLMVGFNRRFDKHFRRLKDALDSGDIGQPELIQITSRDPSPPPVSYIRVSGGLFKDMMIHDLDMACFLMGSLPVTVSAQGSCLVDPAIAEAGDVDTAVVSLEFPTGTLAVISNSRRASYGYDQRIEVHGATGMLQAQNVLETTVIRSSAQGVTGAKPLHFFLERYADAYQAELEAFVRALQENSELSPNGQAGLDALRLAEAAERAFRTGATQRL